MMEPSREGLLELDLRLRALAGLNPPASNLAYRLALLALRIPTELWPMVRETTEP
jgi:hypothetical protein